MRNSRERQCLVEMCRTVDMLLVHHERFTSPRQSNHRLPLRLKGRLSEYKIELL